MGAVTGGAPGGCSDGGFAPSHLLSLPEGWWGSTSCSPPQGHRSRDARAGLDSGREGAALGGDGKRGHRGDNGGVAGAHLPEAVGRFLGGRCRLVVGTRHGSRGGLGRRCGRSVALGQAAASCTGGSRGVRGGQQPRRAEQRPPTLSHPTPLHPHPHPLRRHRVSTQLQGTGRGTEPFRLPSCAPRKPPQGAMQNPDPPQASKPCSSPRVSYATSGQAEPPQSH